jgi:hypothetical protein
LKQEKMTDLEKNKDGFYQSDEEIRLLVCKMHTVPRDMMITQFVVFMIIFVVTVTLLGTGYYTCDPIVIRCLVAGSVSAVVYTLCALTGYLVLRPVNVMLQDIRKDLIDKFKLQYLINTNFFVGTIGTGINLLMLYAFIYWYLSLSLKDDKVLIAFVVVVAWIVVPWSGLHEFSPIILQKDRLTDEILLWRSAQKLYLNQYFLPLFSSQP